MEKIIFIYKLLVFLIEFESVGSEKLENFSPFFFEMKRAFVLNMLRVHIYLEPNRYI